MKFSNAPVYWHLFVSAMREERANPMRMFIAVFLCCFRIGLIAAIYHAAYAVVGKGFGLSYANALWGMALYFALVIGLGMRNAYLHIDRDVKTGDAESALLKPVGWRLSKVAKLLGYNTLEVGLVVIAYTVMLLVLVGPPHMDYVTPLFVAGYSVLLVLSIVATSALFLTVGLTAFWFNDAKPTFRLVDKIIMIFGGAFVPIALMPDMVQTIVRFSPFGVYAASTQLFNPGLKAHLWPTILSALFWTVATIWFCNIIWKRAQRRIEVNGG